MTALFIGIPARVVLGVGMAAVVLLGCDGRDPELMPDAVLRDELGLTDADRVHTIRISSGVRERAEPTSLTVAQGDWVQFVSDDWLVHEVTFAADSLDAEVRDFLRASGQLASPPLIRRDARFVVSFEDAPPGRYPYLLHGNRGSGRGVVVVRVPGER